ncbi:MAG: DNA-3-methyladenine glycosylase [Propionibacteriaceae bacterium]|nr:DNA-3-methyladenine glycosylase [Propionibacteriaceae bacterium]
MFDFAQPVLQVAPLLLGAVIRCGDVAIRLTEVEAYAGTGDPAAHAVGGPRASTQALFGEPGTLYCYLSYGIHICANFVCERSGLGSAVLLRAGEVVAGLELARQRRARDDDASDHTLARGPGCLGQAMGWTLADSGLLAGKGFTVSPRVDEPPISAGPRVGVSVAHQRPWRFWITGDPTVSAYRKSPRAIAGFW